MEPGKHDIHMPLHRGLRNTQLLADLFVAHPFYDELQYLQFAPRPARMIAESPRHTTGWSSAIITRIFAVPVIGTVQAPQRNI